MGDVVGIGAEAAILEQRVTRTDLVHHVAGLVRDFDGAVIQCAAMQQSFAQHLSHGIDGFAPRRFGIRQFLAFFVAVVGIAFTDMEEITGHDLGKIDNFQSRKHPKWGGVPVRTVANHGRRELAGVGSRPV